MFFSQFWQKLAELCVRSLCHTCMNGDSVRRCTYHFVVTHFRRLCYEQWHLCWGYGKIHCSSWSPLCYFMPSLLEVYIIKEMSDSPTLGKHGTCWLITYWCLRNIWPNIIITKLTLTDLGEILSSCRWLLLSSRVVDVAVLVMVHLWNVGDTFCSRYQNEYWWCFTVFLQYLILVLLRSEMYSDHFLITITLIADAADIVASKSWPFDLTIYESNLVILPSFSA